MTIDETLLQKLANWRPDSSADRLTVDDTASGWQVKLSAEQIDSLGCRLRDLTLSRLRPLEQAPPLAEQAGRIAGRITGLLEPLRLVEVDAEHGIAQLRSTAPAQRGDERAYYELVRHADGTTRVGRYQAAPAGKRYTVPFTLTHEALAKLVRDLAAS